MPRISTFGHLLLLKDSVELKQLFLHRTRSGSRNRMGQNTLKWIHPHSSINVQHSLNTFSLLTMILLFLLANSAWFTKSDDVCNAKVRAHRTQWLTVFKKSYFLWAYSFCVIHFACLFQRVLQIWFYVSICPNLIPHLGSILLLVILCCAQYS